MNPHVDLRLSLISTLNPTLRAVVDDPFRTTGERFQHSALVMAPQTSRNNSPRVWGLKDNIDVAGVATTSGSELNARRVPLQDASVVSAVRSWTGAWAVKTNMHQLAFGSTTENIYLGDCRNPWAPSRIPGGSSGGSAAALAAGMVDVALGTDTAGSIRLPAAFCGVVGLRPTTGLISTRGVDPVSTMFDAVGPMARSVREVAWALSSIMGDTRVSDQLRQLSSATHSSGVNFVLGVPENYFFDELQDSVGEAVVDAAIILERAGCKLQPVRGLDPEGVQPALRNIIYREAFQRHRTSLERSAHLIGPDVRERLREASTVGRAAYEAALLRAGLWQKAVRAILEEVDMVLAPTSPIVAPERQGVSGATLSRMTRYVYPWALAHIPALSVPCGLDPEGLPIGLQLAGRPSRELDLLQLGLLFEQQSSWCEVSPPVVRDAVEHLGSDIT